MAVGNVTLKDNSSEVLKELAAKAEKALTAVGIHIEGEAKEELENSPRRIDTGLLRNSITYALSGEAPVATNYHGKKPSKYSKVQAVPIGYYSGTAPNDPDNKKAVYIGTNVEYAGYVHEGTDRMTPNRFLKNACTRNESQIRELINREMKR